MKWRPWSPNAPSDKADEEWHKKMMAKPKHSEKYLELQKQINDLDAEQSRQYVKGWFWEEKATKFENACMFALAEGLKYDEAVATLMAKAKPYYMLGNEANEKIKSLREERDALGENF